MEEMIAYMRRWCSCIREGALRRVEKREFESMRVERERARWKATETSAKMRQQRWFSLRE